MGKPSLLQQRVKALMESMTPEDAARLRKQFGIEGAKWAPPPSGRMQRIEAKALEKLRLKKPKRSKRLKSLIGEPDGT